MNRPTIMVAALCLAVTDSVATATPQFVGQDVNTGTISGHVRDNKGKPIAQVRVVILETTETTETDQSGAYIFTGEDAGHYTIQARGAKYRAETLTMTVQPSLTQTLDLVLVDASHVFVPIAKGKKIPTAIIEVVTSQGYHATPPDTTSNGLSNPFQGDLGLHSTARSR